MNFQKIVATVTILFCTHCLVAQKVVTDIRYFDNYGLKCEGEILELGFNDEISCFKARIGVCGDPSPDIFEDKVNEIEISGPGSPTLSPLRSYTAGSNHATINVMKGVVKLTETGEIRITSRSLFEYIVGDQCQKNPPESYIFERIWIHRVKVVPKPPTPSLTLERYIVPEAEGIKLMAKGCPTDNKEYDYEYQWNNTLCLSEINDFFERRGNLDGTKSGEDGRYYRVRCTALNGTCISEPSRFEMGHTYDPPDLLKVPAQYKDQIKKIEEAKKNDGLPTSYHNYNVETVICSTNDPNCTVSNVFNILKSSNKFIAAITEDMLDIYSSNNNRYSFDNFSPVKSYEVVNLSGPAIRFFLETGLEKVGILLANPIMTYIDERNHSITNYTLPHHILASGRVIRKVVQKCDRIYISTIGEGTSDFLFPTAELSTSILFQAAIAKINEIEGKRLFEIVDSRVQEEYANRYR